MKETGTQLDSYRADLAPREALPAEVPPAGFCRYAFWRALSPGSVNPTRAALRIHAERVLARLEALAPDLGADADELRGEMRNLVQMLQEPCREEIEFSRKLAQEQAARAHAEAGMRREAFLTEAGEILGGSLDYAVTLSSVARLAVPRIADSCVVYVLEENGAVARLGCAHADPGKDELLQDLVRDRPFDAHSLTGPVARTLRLGEAEMLPEMPSSQTDSPIAPRSLMVVPLMVRERILGALSLGWDVPGGYAPEDLWTARKLADRAALAIENARLHEIAKRASEAKSDFVAAMSHEFRTPLTGILAYADLLVAGIPEPVAGAPLRHAQRIVFAAKHLGELIDQVLKISRIEAGRETVQIESFDLSNLVAETVGLVEPLAKQQDLTVHVELPPEPVVIQSDPNKLRQVLFNLVGNAVKFTATGEVRVTLSEHDSKLRIIVRDTGAGISPEGLERIWEPFWRSSQGSTSEQPGTGLGLGIARRLVRMLGGDIYATSAPGEGSTFTVELPKSSHL